MKKIKIIDYCTTIGDAIVTVERIKNTINGAPRYECVVCIDKSIAYKTRVTSYSGVEYAAMVAYEEVEKLRNAQ